MSNSDLNSGETFKESVFVVPTEGMTIADEYVLLKRLGAGATGEAWLAEKIGERRHEHEIIPQVVLKFVPGEVRRDNTEMEKVHSAHLSATNLEHSNICQFHQPIWDARFGWLPVMEFIPGTTLREHAHITLKRKLELAEVVRLLTPIANALDYAHERGILHRDIKPANIMVTPEGKPVIIDFGLAAQIRSSMSTVSRTSTAGTPAFKAPEQWKPDQPLDAKTDQYALGVVAYELLSGRVPFDSDDPFTLGFQVVSAPVPGIAELPNAVNWVLAKALAKVREERFASCTDMMRALESPAAYVQEDKQPEPVLQQVGQQDQNAATSVQPRTSSGQRDTREWGAGAFIGFMMGAGILGGPFYDVGNDVLCSIMTLVGGSIGACIGAAIHKEFGN